MPCETSVPFLYDCRRRRLFCSGACWLLLCVCTGGCSDLASVSGKVAIDDKPLVGGRDQRVTVMFVPESGSGATAAGLVDADGQYTLSTGTKQGIKPGNYLVGITVVEMIRSKGETAPPAGRRLSAPIYADPNRSGFRAEVQSGGNSFDFNLRSDVKDR